MKKYFSILAVLGLVVLGLTSFVDARVGVGPHGGVEVEMGQYHLEFQVASGMTHLFVLDESDKAVSTTQITGSLKIEDAAGVKIEVPLSSMGEALMAMGIDANQALLLTANLKIQGKDYQAVYSYAPTATKPEAVWSEEAVSGHKILKGKIVDIACLLTHNSQSEDHKQCAMQCALKGLPFGILAEDGLIYQIIPTGHLEPKTVNATILDYLEEKVVLEGDVFEKNGTRVVMITKISKL